MTARTAPAPAAVTIDSVVCTSCDTRWWPDDVPIYPEAYVCPVCEQWISLFNTAADSRHIPIVGPIVSVRKLITGNPITADEWLQDQSAWVCIGSTEQTNQRITAMYAELEVRRADS